MARTTRETVLQARQLRQTMSNPEVLLWLRLRKKPLGIKFRRQHPLGPYILDYYCPIAKLGIEVDGRSHQLGDSPERDARRDAYLAKQGIEIIRISARNVMHDPKNVANRILRYVQSLH